jgi:hypothetical protein
MNEFKRSFLLHAFFICFLFAGAIGKLSAQTTPPCCDNCLNTWHILNNVCCQPPASGHIVWQTRCCGSFDNGTTIADCGGVVYPPNCVTVPDCGDACVMGFVDPYLSSGTVFATSPTKQSWTFPTATLCCPNGVIVTYYPPSDPTYPDTFVFDCL